MGDNQNIKKWQIKKKLRSVLIIVDETGHEKKFEEIKRVPMKNTKNSPNVSKQTNKKRRSTKKTNRKCRSTKKTKLEILAKAMPKCQVKMPNLTMEEIVRITREGERKDLIRQINARIRKMPREFFLH